MRRSRILAGSVLMLVVILATLSITMYDRLPWVGLHLLNKDFNQTIRWSVALQLQESNALSNKADLDDVPTPTRSAQLQGIFLQQGQAAGQEWALQLHMESLESVTYSWQQKDNKDLLTSLLEARVGPTGGLRTLEIKPPGRSVWLRPEIVSSWTQMLWPLFRQKGLQPQDKWETSVPFKVHPAELDKTIDANWDSNWTYRGLVNEATVPLAMLDIQATASSSGNALDGTLRAEVAYDTKNQWVAATRGSYQIRYALPVQATQQSTVVLQQCFQVQFQAVRLITAASPTS